MLPAVSSLDSLFADLAFDPAGQGVQIFDAPNFLLRKRKIDNTIPIILLQPRRLGPQGPIGPGGEALATAFPKTHTCYIYQAAPTRAAVCRSSTPLRIADLAHPGDRGRSRPLFVPARRRVRIDRELKGRAEPVGPTPTVEGGLLNGRLGGHILAQGRARPAPLDFSETSGGGRCAVN